MARQSEAEILSARLNPINPQEANVLRILAEKKAQGYNFKQVAVDAINRAEGATPEMFAQDRGESVVQYARQTESLLRQFADVVIWEVRKLGSTGNFPPAGNESEVVDKVTRNFVKGLRDRSGDE